MRQWRRYVLAVGLCVSATALAEVSEIIDYTYYKLKQNNAGQTLQQQLDAATPIERDGRKLHGDTRWRLNWSFNTEAQEDGRCTLSDINIHLDALIYLPELDYRDAELQVEFNRYAEALQRHQIGHYIIAIQAANKMDTRLTYMEPSSDCDTARDQAEAMAVEIEREHREKAIAFDKKTRYGAEQGVSFVASEVAESKEPLTQGPAADE